MMAAGMVSTGSSVGYFQKVHTASGSRSIDQSTDTVVLTSDGGSWR